MWVWCIFSLWAPLSLGSGARLEVRGGSNLGVVHIQGMEAALAGVKRIQDVEAVLA